MELDMAKEKHSSDKITESTLHEILVSINARLGHLEDIEADNRALIVKLIRQSNSIVQFLAQIDIEPADVEFEDMELPPINNSTIESGKVKSLKELIDEYMDKHKDLKEFEEELKKNKDDITPGQVGES